MLQKYIKPISQNLTYCSFNIVPRIKIMQKIPYNYLSFIHKSFVWSPKCTTSKK